MKLSEAIMLNGMTKPQGYGEDSIKFVDAPCALGGALQSIGKQNLISIAANYFSLQNEWPWSTADQSYACPACTLYPWIGLCGTLSIIWHLNDTHHWTRQQIAEWVSRIEPKESPTTCDATVVSHCGDSGVLCGKKVEPGKDYCNDPEHCTE